MLNIGQFSAQCRLSRKALHHYDQIGLLKPAWTDSNTGYRFYEPEQVYTALLITRLKNYGFSLKEIRELLDQQSSPDLYIARLKQQVSLLHHEVLNQLSVIGELQSLIDEYERTGQFMPTIDTTAIQTITTQPLPIFEHRDIISMADFASLFGALFETAARKGIQPGITGSIYYDEEFDPDHADTGVFFVCAPEAATRTIPETKAVSMIHKGGYSTLGETYSALAKYVQDHHLQMIAPPYELYTKNQFHHLPVDQWETQVIFPIA